MPGLRKMKKYNWKDSNMALFGSDTERQVKKASAMCEPAWEGAGTKLGIKIWRIVKFQVTDWPEEDYGKFYNGDSYIILRTYTKAEDAGTTDSENFLYDLHFWIGTKSSQDEYGTAAYKTVELDTFLDDKAVQHRETQGNESQKFKSYFKELVIMTGGADTGFRHVEPRQYKTRLLKVSNEPEKGCEKKCVQIRECPSVNRKYLNSDDVFILDAGTTVYQYNGNNANPFEKARSMEFLQNIESERAGKAKGEVVDEHSLRPDSAFYSHFTEDDAEDDEEDVEIPDTQELFRVSVCDASGKLEFSHVKSGDIEREDLGSDDVFLYDACDTVFVWVGKNASPAEKKNGMSYAHNHLMKSNRQFCPIHVVKEGPNCASLDIALAC